MEEKNEADLMRKLITWRERARSFGSSGEREAYYNGKAAAYTVVLQLLEEYRMKDEIK